MKNKAVLLFEIIKIEQNYEVTVTGGEDDNSEKIIPTIDVECENAEEEELTAKLTACPPEIANLIHVGDQVYVSFVRRPTPAESKPTGIFGVELETEPAEK